MSVTPPCTGRSDLFEPYQRLEEVTSVRGARLTLATEVCRLCPEATRSACLQLGLDQPRPRGVWGGKILTEMDNQEEAR